MPGADTDEAARHALQVAEPVSPPAPTGVDAAGTGFGLAAAADGSVADFTGYAPDSLEQQTRKDYQADVKKEYHDNRADNQGHRLLHVV